MSFPAIQPLLALQERDQKRAALEAQLKAGPAEIARVEREIASEKGAIETARAEMKDLEVKKKLIETEIGSIEDQRTKYRTQQLSVKKNDEYQALGHQIETAQTQIGELEGRELEVMYAGDEARKRFAAAEGVLKQNIAGHEARIRMFRDREAQLLADLKAAQAETTAARGPVPPAVLRVYDKIAARGLPAVVPVHDGKCGGCHLKISSEAESGARGKGPAEEVPVCDQCGRIVYWESSSS